MAPLLPRMHLFEIDDQPWFPSFLRARVQDALTQAWNSQTPLQKLSPARLAASLLINELGPSLPSYTFIDFCAGGGGPTPSIERAINNHLRVQKQAPVDFVLTDLHPNIEAWERVASNNPLITYESEGVDASAAPERLVKREDGKKVMRLFNLAFHHFDDPLATDILKDTVETSQGFAIFELQDRYFSSTLTHFIFGIGVIAAAPYYAWKWRSPATLIFTWLIPILPFVLIFDGFMSSIRTRTPDEIEALLRSCGADTSEWELKSGSERHLWPCGYLNWIICKPVDRAS
ncbi:Fc.00g038320.m01.CDS01 [Cosmosporella sp. VM-42]